MLFTDLPLEILDRIVANLDSPIDLRNLSAVCTQLHSLVEPNHTQFRVIRTQLISPIWRKLAQNRLLAQNIRVLEVRSGNCTTNESVIPAIFHDMEVPSVPELDGVDEDDADALRTYWTVKNDMDVDAAHSLVSALKGMSGLTSFRWTRSWPLINRDQDDIWIVLAKNCPSLDVIDVIDRNSSEAPLRGGDNAIFPRPTFNPNFYLFNDLKSFLFKTDAYNVGNFVFPDVDQCGKMLVERCPNLEVLKLHYILHENPNTQYAPASPLLSGPPWTSLRELTLSGFYLVSTELSSFLASHPAIEALSLKPVQAYYSLLLPPGALPRLKRLSTDRMTVTRSILDSTILTPRPLEYINSTWLDDLFLDSLEQCGSGPILRKFLMICGHAKFNQVITRLSSIAPNLEHLNLKILGAQTARTLLPSFCQFRHLRSLQGMRLLSSDCDPASENTEIIRALLTKCPNLRKMDWYEGASRDTSSIVIIERNGSLVTWSLRRLVEGMEGDVNPLWSERGERDCGRFRL